MLPAVWRDSYLAASPSRFVKLGLKLGGLRHSTILATSDIIRDFQDMSLSSLHFDLSLQSVTTLIPDYSVLQIVDYRPTRSER